MGGDWPKPHREDKTSSRHMLSRLIRKAFLLGIQLRGNKCAALDLSTIIMAFCCCADKKVEIIIAWVKTLSRMGKPPPERRLLLTKSLLL